MKPGRSEVGSTGAAARSSGGLIPLDLSTMATMARLIESPGILAESMSLKSKSSRQEGLDKADFSAGGKT